MTLVVEAGRFVDARAGRVLEDARVLVEGERVTAVLGPGESPPVGADTLDLRDCTVLPGLIDLHTHLVGPMEAGDLTAVLHRSPAEEALVGVANARTTLEAGVTTVRDVGTFWAFVDVDLRNAIDAGVVEGPRMHCAGAYITRSGGGGEVTGVPDGVVVPPEMRVGVADSVEEVRRAAERIIAGGADLLKVIATGAVLAPGTEPGEPELTEQQIRAAVEVAREHGTFVAAHAHGAEGIKRAVRAGVRSIEHGSLIDDEALALMKQRGTWLVADIWNGDYTDSVGRAQKWPADILRKNTETTELQRAGFRKAVALGVRIAFGTDSGIYPHGLNAMQLPYMVKYGMTPMQAIQSATISAAELMQWKDSVGSLTPGKYADIIAVEGDALADLRSFMKVGFVMKGGTVYQQ